MGELFFTAMRIGSDKVCLWPVAASVAERRKVTYSVLSWSLLMETETTNFFEQGIVSEPSLVQSSSSEDEIMAPSADGKNADPEEVSGGTGCAQKAVRARMSRRASTADFESRQGMWEELLDAVAMTLRAIFMVVDWKGRVAEFGRLVGAVVNSKELLAISEREKRFKHAAQIMPTSPM